MENKETNIMEFWDDQMECFTGIKGSELIQCYNDLSETIESQILLRKQVLGKSESRLTRLMKQSYKMNPTSSDWDYRSINL